MRAAASVLLGMASQSKTKRRRAGLDLVLVPGAFEENAHASRLEMTLGVCQKLLQRGERARG